MDMFLIRAEFCCEGGAYQSIAHYAVGVTGATLMIITHLFQASHLLEEVG